MSGGSRDRRNAGWYDAGDEDSGVGVCWLVAECPRSLPWQQEDGCL